MLIDVRHVARFSGEGDQHFYPFSTRSFFESECFKFILLHLFLYLNMAFTNKKIKKREYMISIKQLNAFIRKIYII